MTGATSNITTQWTFRDGRDYVLSLNTTETPNTISFWISDKITGEEWTGCYDENAIELLTKRTGCYKSFQIFLSMIKSAMLKKSEAVVLDLLNLEDLTAMSVQRQNSARLGSAMSSLLPLPFQMYNGDILTPPTTGGGRHTKSRTSTGDPNERNTNNKSGASQLNKRKYLIVTYVGEFDKVHYPLPLNYSCPPDLSVMQSNIVKLKAEVTSLRSANKDLVQEIESLRSGSAGEGMRTSQESHISVVSRYNSQARINTSDSAEVESVFVSKRDIASGMDSDHKEFNEDDLKNANVIEDNEDNNKKGNSSVTDASAATSNTNICAKCSETIGTLQSKVRELEDCLNSERDQHLQSMETVENENHFLRHKVEAAEKYEMELWNQIQHLKEKVVKTESNLEKERKRVENLKNNQCHQSRHDLFYNSRYTSVPFAKRVGGATAISPVGGNSSKNRRTNTDVKSNDKDRIPCSRSHSQKQEQQQQRIERSRSNSSSLSYRGYDEIAHTSIRKGVTGVKQSPRTKAKSLNDNERSRSSSVGSNNSIEMHRRQRNSSPSPTRRFDPTAYIKMKQSKIANLRMKKIEARLDSSRSKSNTRILPRPSSSQKPNNRNSPSPSRGSRNQRSMSAGNDSHQSRPNSAEREMISVITSCITGDPRKFRLPSFQNTGNGNRADDRSRSSSGESGKTRTIPTYRQPQSHSQTPKKENTKLTVLPGRSHRHSLRFPPSNVLTDFERHLIRSQARTSVNIRTSKSPRSKKTLRNTTVIRDVNTPIADALESEPLFILEDDQQATTSTSNRRNTSAGASPLTEQNEKNSEDISFLQAKLAALQVFLETCKSKSKPSSQVQPGPMRN